MYVCVFVCVCVRLWVCVWEICLSVLGSLGSREICSVVRGIFQTQPWKWSLACSSKLFFFFILGFTNFYSRILLPSPPSFLSFPCFSINDSVSCLDFIVHVYQKSQGQTMSNTLQLPWTSPLFYKAYECSWMLINTCVDKK